ncbi:hypothetical protein PG988_010784 [Apiospora saccharicola]
MATLEHTTGSHATGSGAGGDGDKPPHSPPKIAREHEEDLSDDEVLEETIRRTSKCCANGVIRPDKPDFKCHRLDMLFSGESKPLGSSLNTSSASLACPAASGSDNDISTANDALEMVQVTIRDARWPFASQGTTGKLPGSVHRDAFMACIRSALSRSAGVTPCCNQSRGTLGKCFDCAQDNNHLCPPPPATTRHVARTLVAKLSSAQKREMAAHRRFLRPYDHSGLGTRQLSARRKRDFAVANEQLPIGNPLGSSLVSIPPQDNKYRKDRTSQVIMFSSLAGSSLLLSRSVENSSVSSFKLIKHFLKT